MGETYVDSYFLTTFLITPCPSLEKYVLAKALALKLFQFCDLKTQHCYILQEQVNFSTENSVLWLTVCVIFSKLLIKPAIVYRFHYQNQKLNLDLPNQKIVSLLITGEISLNIQIDKFVDHSDLETTILAYFPSKV